MKHLFLVFLLLGIAPLTTLAAPPQLPSQPNRPFQPLINAHAHNDYEHQRPLQDALDNGFCSIEADIHLVDGTLLVAHDRKDVSPDRNLESLYLEPLQKRAMKNGGRIYQGGPRSITLLVDVKSEASPTYAVLKTVLEKYAQLLTVYHGKKKTLGAVTVILSGSRPSLTELAADSVRYAAYDGRLSDLDNHISPDLMPLVSQDWGEVSHWKGESGVALPDEDKQRIAEIVARTHAQGYQLRFWATPDTPESWRVVRDLHIDWINTDDLRGLRSFLLSEKIAQ